MQRLTMLAAGNNKNRNSVKQRPQEEKVEEEEEAAAAKPPGDDNGDDKGDVVKLREEDEVLEADAETTETNVFPMTLWINKTEQGDCVGNTNEPNETSSGKFSDNTSAPTVL